MNELAYISDRAIVDKYLCWYSDYERLSDTLDKQETKMRRLQEIGDKRGYNVIRKDYLIIHARYVELYHIIADDKVADRVDKARMRLNKTRVAAPVREHAYSCNTRKEG
jgi:hypothetical protein